MSQEENNFVRLLRELNNGDTAEVGGKNASLGEMIGALSQQGIQVPGGFATTEDLPEACFAGQQETYLNISGEDDVLEALSPFFNEMDRSVTTAIEPLIDAAYKAGIKIGICGHGPSDKPEFAEFLVAHGIDSMSLNPDSVADTLKRVAKLESSGS